MVVRSVSGAEVAKLCASPGVLTLVSESAAAYACVRFGLSPGPGGSSSVRRAYLKRELIGEPTLLRRLCDDRSNHTVVGIGSGWLCDIAKVVGHAWSKQRSDTRVVLVPSALTTNAPFTHKGVADEQHMALAEPPSQGDDAVERGNRHSVVTGFPDAVWICHELLERPGNGRFNRAGLGDPLSSITGVFDNVLADRDIKEPEKRRWYHADIHPEINDEACEMVRRIGEVAPEIKANTREGIDAIVTALNASARWHYHAPRVINGSEHLFAEAAEKIIRRKGKLALHGELLSVGILCALHLQNRRDEIAPTRDLLGSLGLPVNYTALGLSRTEALRALGSAVDYRPDKYGILNVIKDKMMFERALDEVFDKTLLGIG